VLIVSHQRPDGDSIGSQLGLYHALKSIGRQVKILNEDPVPEMFRFLDGWKHISRSIPKEKFETVFFLDASSVSRAGHRIAEYISKISKNAFLVNIDHHQSNELFGAANHVVTDASSTSEILFKMLKGLKIDIGKSSAEAFLTGIITDTGMFKFETVEYGTLKSASKLMFLGASAHRIAHQVYMERPFPKIKLMSEMLIRAEIIGDKIISYLKETDFAKYSAKQEYTDGLVNELLFIKGMNAAILLTEESGGKIRISFRSKGSKYDMNKFAASYNGGGHYNAAGAVMELPLMSALKRIKCDFDKL